MNKKIRNTLIGTLVVIGAFAIPVGLQLGKVGYEDTTDNKPVDPYANIQDTRTYIEEEYVDVDITFAEAFLVEYNEAFTWVDEELVIDTEGTEYTYVTDMTVVDNDYTNYIIDLRDGEEDLYEGDYIFSNTVILMDEEDVIKHKAPTPLSFSEDIEYTVQVGGTIDLTYYNSRSNTSINNSILDVTFTTLRQHTVNFNHNLELSLTVREIDLKQGVVLEEGWFDEEYNLFIEPAELYISDTYLIPTVVK